MKLDTYVYLPGQTTRQEMLDRTLWLPDVQQMWAAARLNVEDALDPAERKLIGVTMRQGIGMIAVLGLLAGIDPPDCQSLAGHPDGNKRAAGTAG